jgi:Cys-tRNA(Pro)/Cys-tRNA(Cys) deacylase
MVALDAISVRYVAHAFDHDVATSSDVGYGRAAAAALGVEEERVFKTLLARTDREFVVAIVPVDSTVSLKALATALGVKRCEMARPEDAQRVTGYVVGGISPFGQKKMLATVIDESSELFDTIFVSGGRRGLDLEIAPADLIAALGARSAPIAQGRER